MNRKLRWIRRVWILFIFFCAGFPLVKMHPFQWGVWGWMTYGVLVAFCAGSLLVAITKAAAAFAFDREIGLTTGIVMGIVFSYVADFSVASWQPWVFGIVCSIVFLFGLMLSMGVWEHIIRTCDKDQFGRFRCMVSNPEI
jgi:hypothetical protein